MKGHENSVTILVTGVFREGYEVYFEEYSEKVRVVLRTVNAATIRRQLLSKNLYGTDQASLFMVIDFESREVAENIFFQDAYLAIIPLREKVFKTFNMWISG